MPVRAALLAIACFVAAWLAPGCTEDQTPQSAFASADAKPVDAGDAAIDTVDPGADTGPDTLVPPDAPVDTAPDTLPDTPPDAPPDTPTDVPADVPDTATADTAETADASDPCAGKPQGCGCTADADCKPLAAADQCAGTWFCDLAATPSQCKLNAIAAVVCKGPLPGACSVPKCNPQTGQCDPVPLSLGVTCSDGIECTTGDACDGKGSCKAGATTCCTSDADCAAQEDGNLCNGTLYCHMATGNCVLNPLTVVTCPSVDDTACTSYQCQPKSGQCAPVAKPDKTPCSDSNFCTVGDTCQKGLCVGSATTCQCFTSEDCKDDDANKCTGVPYCDQATGTCKSNPATVVTCPWGLDTPCSKHLCNPKTGGCEATYVPNDTPCDDGNKCTVGDKCAFGSCQSGTGVCECQKDADCAGKEDGNLCNGTLFCEPLTHTCQVNPASVKSCPDVDDTYCVKNLCNPKNGKCEPVQAPDLSKCSDFSDCTVGDVCMGGKCQPGTDLCACKQDGDCKDQDLCDGVDFCNKSAAPYYCMAKPFSKVKCEAGEPCQGTVCEPKTGKCVQTVNGTPCSDGNACTDGDGCLNKTCQPGSPVPCDDQNACTSDSCDKQKGCQFAPNAVPCDDGNACSVGDKCGSGACLPGAATLNCDDGNTCTADACDLKKGCTQANANEGQACGLGAVCKAGVCVGAGKALAVTAGANHACLLTTLGGVMCWGGNASGQLGDGTTTDRYVPGPVTLPGVATAVVAGGFHTCALLTTGAVRCWGQNDYGQLGVGSGTAQPNPEAVAALGQGVAALAAGGSTTCAITKAGGLLCWGRGDSGQIGDGKATDAGKPVAVPGLDAGVETVAVGGQHVCAAVFGGQVLCWGRNVEGQLGLGAAGGTKTSPELLDKLPIKAAALVANHEHTCALDAAGATWCWGENLNGELGAFGSPVAAPQLVATGSKALALGAHAACRIDAAGDVQCRGRNAEGQLGRGDLIDDNKGQYVTAQIAGKAKALAAGGNFACAVLAGGALQCWGDDWSGQTGTGQANHTPVPQPVTGLGGLPVLAAAVGPDHTCAVLAGGGVRCWGLNADYQAGQPKGYDFATPQPVPGLAALPTATQLDAGAHHTCLVTQAGAVHCWGSNENLQLGALGQPPLPVEVQGLGAPAVEVRGGGLHTCARLQGGAVKCWGRGSDGQLGQKIGAAGYTEKPQLVAGLAEGADAIAVGGFFSCARKAGGVQCWGDGSVGQLGNGKIDTGVAQPVAVTGLEAGVTHLCAAYGHACAVQAGAVKCWGQDDVGQIGDGGAIDPNAKALQPVAVDGLGASVQEVVCGRKHSCALLVSGAVKCWGANDAGQLGDFSTVGKSAPSPVFGLAGGATDLWTSPYGSVTCARVVGGAIKCWGQNDAGQLGTGTAGGFQKVPVALTVAGDFKSLAHGDGHTCGLLADGKAVCWGQGGKGQMGDGSGSTYTTPHTPGGIAAIAAGSTFTWALTSGGTVLHWGAALPAAGFKQVVGPGATPAVFDSASVVSMSAGKGFGCVVRGDSIVFCAGLNDKKQTVGQWATCDYTPGNSVGLPLGYGGGALAVATGLDFACAKVKSGGATCWGNGNSGQAGLGAVGSCPYGSGVVAAVSGIDGPVKVLSTGAAHSCALLDSGAVQCWGDGGAGALGNGTSDKVPVAKTVQGLSQGVVAVTAGHGHSCAVLASGKVKCWGQNAYGAVGVANPANHLSPVDVVGLPPMLTATALAQGYGARHTCAILANGQLWCWGDDLHGQLGNGGPLQHTPAFVQGFAP